MTIRALILRRYDRLVLIGFGCWLSAGALIIASQARVVPDWLVFVPVAGFVACALSLFFAIRCPRCRGSFGHLAGYLKPRFAFIARPVNYCPYCGVSLDEPVAASPD